MQQQRVGAGFPRPDASITDAGGENRPYTVDRIYFSNTISARLSSKAALRKGGVSFRGYCNVRAPQNSLEETLSLADPRRRRNRAAPFARRLAAGVGGRVEVPRDVAD